MKYRVNEWPDFDILEPTGSNLDAIAMMRSGFVSHGDLRNKAFMDDNESLYLLIENLREQGVLVEEPDDTPVEVAKAVPIKQSNFAQKLRSFFRLATSD